MTPFQQKVLDLAASSYQAMLVPTIEEKRALISLQEVAERLGWSLILWSPTTGLSSGGEKPEVTQNFISALERIRDKNYRMPKKAIIACTGLESITGEYRRFLFESIEQTMLSGSDINRPLVIIQSSANLPHELQKLVPIVEFGLPSRAELEVMVEAATQATSINDKVKLQPVSDEDRYTIAKALQGMSKNEADNCLMLCQRKHRGKLDRNILPTIEDMKKDVLRATGALTYIPREQIPDISQLAGYDHLVSWMRRKSLAYSRRAEEIKLDRPKGCALVGIPGSGKSVAAKAIAGVLHLPLVQFDFGSVFSKFVGGSEHRMDEIINTVKAIDGCVLLVDEADKALAGVGGSGETDSGVSKRVFGKLLDWMASKNDQTFVVMTLNRVKGMPPELLRKGRVDEIFYVDAPGADVRRQIFEIHMRRRNVDPTIYTASQWKDFIFKSRDLVGAEIEEAVIAARFAQFEADPAGLAVPTSVNILEAIEYAKQTCVIKTDAENVGLIRKYGEDCGRPVCAPAIESAVVSNARRSVDIDTSAN